MYTIQRRYFFEIMVYVAVHQKRGYMKKVKIKNNLRKYRLERRITQAELADAVGVSRTTVGNIERCQSAAGYKTALKLSLALHVPFEKIFKIEERKRFKLEE